jgi:hypothetical protein
MTDTIAIFAIILSVLSVAVCVYTLISVNDSADTLTIGVNNRLDNIKQDTDTDIDKLRCSLDGAHFALGVTRTAIWDQLHDMARDLKPLKRLSDIENMKAMVKCNKEVAAHWADQVKVYQDRLKNLQKEAR